ncbi:MAG TPA: hypothetical protein VHT28_15650 [Silvibacterium sp.]|nr:hypothetical protein [Silvibacterium sp.]
MRDQKPVSASPLFRWTIFLVLLGAVSTWSIRSTLVHAKRMKPAATSAAAFSTLQPGARATAVVQLDKVSGESLTGTLLQRESDTVYRRTVSDTNLVSAILTPKTAVVMGKAEDILPGAIVQISGVLDTNHALQADQVVILTGYVNVTQGPM